MKDNLLETLIALRIIYWCMGNGAAMRQIESNIKQHEGEPA